MLIEDGGEWGVIQPPSTPNQEYSRAPVVTHGWFPGPIQSVTLKKTQRQCPKRGRRPTPVYILLRVQPSPMLLYTVSPSQLPDWLLFCVTRVTLSRQTD